MPTRLPCPTGAACGPDAGVCAACAVSTPILGTRGADTGRPHRPAAAAPRRHDDGGHGRRRPARARHAAALTPTGDRTPGDRDAGIECLDPQPPARIAFDFQDWIRDREAALARRTGTQRIGDREHAILVSVTAGRSARDLEVHIAELRDLAHSAGVDIIDVVTQNRPRVDPKTVLGSGKLDELVIRAFQSDVDLVIVDQDLTPTQARNLGERMELRVIDRTQLILDIFAQHATTRDGKLQVELAQLKYLLPRLAKRADVSLSRLAGGIGGRGPGETKLEVDRRRVRDRLTRLERELKKLAAQRENRRQRRGRRAVPVCPSSAIRMRAKARCCGP